MDTITLTKDEALLALDALSFAENEGVISRSQMDLSQKLYSLTNTEYAVDIKRADGTTFTRVVELEDLADVLADIKAANQTLISVEKA